MAPEETKMTSWPRLRRETTSSAKPSSQARLRRPFSPSTSKVDPTFTTTRLASVKRWAMIFRSAAVLGQQYSHFVGPDAFPNILLPAAPPPSKTRAPGGEDLDRP